MDEVPGLHPVPRGLEVREAEPLRAVHDDEERDDELVPELAKLAKRF